MKIITFRVLLFFILISSISNSQNILPIPPLYTGTLDGTTRTFDLTMAEGTTEFFTGVQTPTSGYNGSFLGPTMLFRKGDSVVLNVTNNLGETTTTHWHGFHVPAVMDGGPHQMILDGTTWQASWRVLNRASTYWYHPHLMPPPDEMWNSPNGTGGQVYQGLAGMIIVEDDEVDALNLPSTYGVDDIPLIFTDRAFNEDGTFLEFKDSFVRIRKGDTPIVNGAVTPEHDTPAQLIRFRLLNASNGRIYYFGLSDDRSFMQIGSDGGLLTAPVDLDRLELAPGERAEIIVDFSTDSTGDIIQLMSYASELAAAEQPVPPDFQDAMDNTDYPLVTFNITSTTISPAPVTTIPSSLIDIPLFDQSLAVNVDNPRPFVLGSEETLTINGKEMNLNFINETVYLGDIEIWEIINTSGQDHPFHVHGEPFQVIYRSDTGVEVEIPDNEKGWKDVVLVPGSARGEDRVVRIIKQFLDFADPNSDAAYMYHCHILEHEDLGMMGQFLVIENPDTDTPSETAENITIMEYNVGSSDWEGNKDAVIERITTNDPDILGAIEASTTPRSYLEDNLSDYDLLETFGDNPNVSESHIFYRKGMFNVLDSGYELMETYTGYMGPDRYVNWAKFEEISTDNPFYVYASHILMVDLFDPEDDKTIGQYNHVEGMTQLMNTHASDNLPMIIPMITLGDFNATESSDVMRFLLDQTPITYDDGTMITNPIVLNDSWYEANPSTTKPSTVSGPSTSSIDWILTTPDINVVSAIIDETDNDGVYPSDHYPLMISINFELSLTQNTTHKNDIVVYPNPVNNLLNFKLDTTISGPLEVKIYDLLGKLVRQEVFNSITDQTIQINLSHLQTSIYFYTLSSTKGIITGKIIKVSK